MSTHGIAQKARPRTPRADDGFHDRERQEAQQETKRPCTERIEQNGRKCRNGKYQARDSLVGHTVRELQIQDRTGNGCSRIYGIIEAVRLRREVEFIDVDEGRDGQVAI